MLSERERDWGLVGWDFFCDIADFYRTRRSMTSFCVKRCISAPPSFAARARTIACERVLAMKSAMSPWIILRVL